MHVRMHVHALDRAAALPAVEHRPVHQLRRRPRQVRVRPHVRRVVAAQLEDHRDDAPGGGFAQLDAAGGGAGEGDQGDVGELYDLGEGFGRAGVDELEYGGGAGRRRGRFRRGALPLGVFVERV